MKTSPLLLTLAIALNVVLTFMNVIFKNCTAIPNLQLNGQLLEK